MGKNVLKTRLLVLFLMLIVNYGATSQSLKKQQWNVYVIPTSITIPTCTMLYYSDDRFGQFAGYTYRLLYSQSDIIDEDPIGMYREDNGKIFLRELINMTPSEEYLIYDWNLNIGDTAYVQHGCSETGLVLCAITDTVINNENRRVFHLNYAENMELTEIWIEGMGSELGFPFSGTKSNPVSFNYYPMTTDMLCYYEDDELSWDNPNYDECMMGGVLGTNDIENIESICIYPNPAYEDITIKHYGCNYAILEIFDSLGRKIYGDIIDGLEKTIDIRSFPNGLYYVVVKNLETTKQIVLIKY